MTSAFQHSAKALHQLAGSVFGKPVSRPLWHALNTNGISRVQRTRRDQRGGTYLCRPIAVIVSAFRRNLCASCMTAPTWTCYAAQLRLCTVIAQHSCCKFTSGVNSNNINNYNNSNRDCSDGGSNNSNRERQLCV